MASLPLRVVRRLRRVHHDAMHVRKLLHSRVHIESAIEAVQRRLPQRAEGFLDMVERTIFAHQRSPYKPLLEAAGYDFARIRALVAEDGLEGTLRRLCHDGAYVSIEEFKGIKEARRGGHTFHFDPDNFDNPLVQSGLWASSGGTRSPGIPTTISFADHRMGIEDLAVALRAYDVLGRPAAVWVSSSSGVSVWGIAAIATLGTASSRWFTMLPERGRLSGLFDAVARFYGVTLPRLTDVPIGGESTVIEWTKQSEARYGCWVLTLPSFALRLALSAKRLRTDLANVTFITLGEPLTPAKLTTIRGVGARAFSSLGFTEFGRVTYGCTSPNSADDGHICKDAVAVIQRRRAVDHMGTEVDALLFTALWPHARKILLNMETGDYATMTSRRCGCPLEALGWTDHLEEIRSFEKLNAVGRTFWGSGLYSLVEEVLPARFGGEPTDYQLVEEEDQQGFTRLSALVHPRLGPVDEKAIVECIEETLHAVDRVQAAVWQESEVVRIRRASPMLTKAGKFMPLHHLRTA